MEADDVVKLLKEAKVEEALNAADKVKDKKEMSEKLVEFAGTLNYLKGLPGITEVLLKKAIILDPKNPYAHYNIGNLFSEPELLERDGNNMKKAELAYKNALKHKSDFHQARYNLALLLYFQGREKEARQEYRKILNAIGDDPRYRDLGMMFLDDERQKRR